MKVKQSSVLFSLKKLADWIEKLPESKRGHEATENRVEDVVCGCFDLMQYSPTTNVAGWIASKPRRQKLDHPAKAVWTKEGRRAIVEILCLDDTLRRMIAEKRAIADIKEQARLNGTRFLRDAALDLAFRGETTLEEVARVTLQA